MLRLYVYRHHHDHHFPNLTIQILNTSFDPGCIHAVRLRDDRLHLVQRDVICLPAGSRRVHTGQHAD